MSFTLQVHIDTEAAILAGRSLLGEQVIVVDDKHLASLGTPEMLYELAQALISPNKVGERFCVAEGVEFKDPPLAAPEWAAVVTILAHRAKLRREHLLAQEQKAKAAAAEAEKQRAEAVRRDEEERVARIEADRLAAARKLTLRKWVEKHGDENQRARLREGLLPDDEVLEGVREQVFDELDTNERYANILAEEVCTCACQDEIAFRTTAPPSLTATQYDRLGEFRENAPKGAQVEPRLHVGKCPACDCPAVKRLGVHLSVEWNGFTLTREYVLD